MSLNTIQKIGKGSRSSNFLTRVISRTNSLDGASSSKENSRSPRTPTPPTGNVTPTFDTAASAATASASDNANGNATAKGPTNFSALNASFNTNATAAVNKPSKSVFGDMLGDPVAAGAKIGTPEEQLAIQKWGADWKQKAKTNWEISQYLDSLNNSMLTSARTPNGNAPRITKSNPVQQHKAAIEAHKRPTIATLFQAQPKTAVKPVSGLLAIQAKIASSGASAGAMSATAVAAMANDPYDTVNGGWHTKTAKKFNSDGSIEIKRSIVDTLNTPTQADLDFIAPDDGEDGGGDMAMEQIKPKRKQSTGANGGAKKKKKGSVYVDMEAGHDAAADRAEFGIGAVSSAQYEDEDGDEVARANLEEMRERKILQNKVSQRKAELQNMMRMKMSVEEKAKEDPSKEAECKACADNIDTQIDTAAAEIADLEKKIQSMQPITTNGVAFAKKKEAMSIQTNSWFRNLEQKFNPSSLRAEAMETERKYRELVQSIVTKHVSAALETASDQYEQKVSKKSGSVVIKKIPARDFSYVYTTQNGEKRHVFATYCCPDRFAVIQFNPADSSVLDQHPKRVYTGAYQRDYFDAFVRSLELKTIFPSGVEPTLYPAFLYFVDRLSISQAFD